ncbi:MULTISPECIES: nuclease-related domain-containing protein [Pontibacillus]|uniref:Nuclease-related domain-containing protein n=1 Tax=Pontibacillus chungwhensis TaxID=265426 RepID=A0ABY8UZU0_9BACI|nr:MULTISPECIES: nuclease-related domain-containing protein [Pontibacillus]MCD5325385.1 NERD domain-containing protein [Pontibacillus sp. HN14]WIF98502.1 nuclease-related domain-containing protein [Pontibacillus chungwhensis]
MPLYKPRTKPSHLTILETLQKRTSLSSKASSDYARWLKGFEGEQRFDHFIEPLANEAYLLHDLLLKKQNTTFQIDTLMITSEKIYLFEIKNYEGDFIYEDNQFYRLPKNEILNPLHQLQRATSLLGQLLKSQGYTLPIEGYVIFINPHFHLYQAPLTPTIIFPTQLTSFLDQLKTSSPLTSFHKKLAEELHALHITDSSLNETPSYTFDNLRKGITCLQCSSLSVEVEGHKCICKSCGAKEKSSQAILRSVEELQLLFPEEKIKTQIVYEWCGQLGSLKRIRSVLQKHFTMKSVNQWAYFE